MRVLEEVTKYHIIKLPYLWPLSHEGKNDEEKKKELVEKEGEGKPGSYPRQGEEGDRPRPQKISTKFGPQKYFFRGLLGPKIKKIALRPTKNAYSHTN